ncbi:MAG: OmpH family outer membrane protein, partial [Desulfobulbales bacterium]|nr:OmpH family outer membrane protein [Desulfobulbales bacterium]
MPQKLLASLCFCLTLVFCSSQPVSAQDSIKIGTMNLQKILALSETGQATRSSVTEKLEGYQKKLRKQEEAVIALKDEIEKKSGVWSEDVRTKKQREFRRLAQALEEESEYASNDIKTFEQQQVEPILKMLEEIIDEYGKNKGYSLILDISKGVLYEDESLDISKDLAAELDKRSSAA